MPTTRTKKPKQPTLPVPEICSELRRIQRMRAITIKSRIIQANRLQAIVAGTLGYSAHIKDEAERKRLFTEASTLIKRVMDGEADDCSYKDIIQVTMVGINAFNEMKKTLERDMKKLSAQLPVAAWVEAPEQAGFGLLGLAIIIGETGDLSGYSNPAKVWARLGCAPYTFEGDCRMGATWKSGKYGKLPPEHWGLFGYSPRRRSIAYLVGEGLVKQNKDGPYRQRFKQVKIKAYKDHPDWDWKTCDKCDGSGAVDGEMCPVCFGNGQKCQHANLHAMLLMTKMLLRNLWREWNGHPTEGRWPDPV